MSWAGLIMTPKCQANPMPERDKRKANTPSVYFVLEEYLVTALVPSETACLASSPGRMRRTDVWISREEMVDFLLYAASLEASVATRSKMSEVIRLENAS